MNRTEFSYADAVECTEAERESMINRVLVALKNLPGKGYETLSTGDTTIIGAKDSYGGIRIEECKVRRTIHYAP